MNDHELEKIGAHNTKNSEMPPVELWLKGFRDAEIVITNSFHGMVFSIINQTDFVVIGRKVGGLSRIMDFLKKYDLMERFVDEENLANFDLKNLSKINWAKISEKINRDQRKSADWLLEQLTKAK